MKKLIYLLVFSMTFVLFTSCTPNEGKKSSDAIQQQQTELALSEANRQVGMPSITNFQEKKNLKWIYELCDQQDFICYAYLANELNGTVGQYLGECVGYGIPYSTQFSNPEKLIDVTKFGVESYQSNDGMIIQQAEPNGLFKPAGLSATWLIMINPVTKKPQPVYIEPAIIVSPFKLK